VIGGAAIMVARIATGEIEEAPVKSVSPSKAAKAAGAAKAER
jgi:hypothetical protein